MVENKNWSVYLHIFPNGKVYVGITSKPPNKRWGYLGHNYIKTGHHNIMSNAIMKYGWDNIKHIVLCKTSEREAKILEIALIGYYKRKSISYNITDGGDGTSGLSKIPWNVGIPCSLETRYKISKANKGKTGFWKGKSLSDETRKKISKTRKLKGIKGTIDTSIQTLLYSQDGNLINTFKSGAELARYLNISSAYVNNCIKNNRLCRGFKIIQCKKC